MKIGAQTVIWGNQIGETGVKLELLAQTGCEGAEFSQRPDQLPKAPHLKTLLAANGIKLLGLSGGTVTERVNYCADVFRPAYLYVEDWNDQECEMAISRGFTLALHPHLFKPIHRLAQAQDLLRKEPRLRYLPDVAHLTIAGDSISEAIANWSDRIAAVHVKDWTPIYGRSSHRYARGFVSLGEGVVNWDMLFEKLKQAKFDGWLVFEQGNPDLPPEMLVRKSSSWLLQKIGRTFVGRISPRPPPTPSLRTAQASTGFSIVFPDSLTPIHAFPDREERDFVETMFRAAIGESPDYYPRLTDALGKLLKAKLVLLCACTPANDMLGVLGLYPPDTRIGQRFMRYADSLSNVAVERQAITDFDLMSAQPAKIYGHPNARFGYPDLISKLKLRTLTSVPVLNPHNPHQARFVLNIVWDDKNPRCSNEDLTRLGALLAQAADAALDERCALAAASASVRAGQAQQSMAFLKKLKELLLDTLHCQTLTIFLVNEAGNRLEEAESTGLRWDPSVQSTERFYSLGEGLLGQLWERREPLICIDPKDIPGSKMKSDESKPNRSPSYLCAPMVDTKGAVVGFVRCQNKSSHSDAIQMFSDDDLAVLDAVCQAAVPHLQVLLSKERRAKALRRLSHELQNPLVAIRGAADRMRSDLVRRRSSSEDFFSEDYIGDVEAWAELMRGLLGNADVFRLGEGKLQLERKRIYLHGDVFMPAINQIHMLLVDRHFERRQITVPHFEEIPRLWLDRQRFTQVVFNLLSNCIKYAHEDPNHFRVIILARETATGYEISFSDRGLGIPETMKEAIFLEGVRSDNAEQQHVAGDGLGLWVVRRIMDAHGGSVKVTSCANPTTVTLFLPKNLGAVIEKGTN